MGIQQPQPTATLMHSKYSLLISLDPPQTQVLQSLRIRAPRHSDGVRPVFLSSEMEVDIDVGDKQEGSADMMKNEYASFIQRMFSAWYVCM